MSKSTFPPESAANADASRRHWLMAAVAGAATLGGAALAWRRYQPQALKTSAESTLWQMEFPGLDGKVFRMTSLQGKPVLLNFWATWCPPCIEELPLLSNFYLSNSAKGWQVLGLAVDQLEPVKRFLARSPVTFPVALAGLPGVELGKSLGNASGGLPFTVVMGSDGRVAHRKIGKVSAANLRDWAALG